MIPQAAIRLWGLSDEFDGLPFAADVGDEVRKLLQSERVRDELLKMIAGMTLEVRAEVKLVPDRVKGEAPSLLPKVRVSDLKTTYDKKSKDDEPEA
jgi:hypothetical protein